MTKFATLILFTLLGPTVFAKSNAALDELHLVEGDETGNEVKSLKGELLVSESERKAVAQAQTLLKQYRNTPMEAEILFRLAELYMRRAKTDRFFEVHRESETIVKLAPRLVKESSSRKTIEAAVSTYADIQKRFPDFSQMDLVIFNQAFASQSLGLEKNAEALYQTLINTNVSSPLVPDAHLAIGEIAFQRGQFPVALDHFNAIKKYPESRVYPYGLYKSAWTLYNLRDAEQALRKLEEVVAYGRFVTEGHVDARLDLRKEALNDMTLFYEDVFPAKDAFQYFKTQAGPEELGPVLMRLSDLYERHARFEDQKTTLLALAARLPKSPLMTKVNVNLVQAYDHLKDKTHAVERLAEFSKSCVTAGPECVLAFNDLAQKMARKWLRAWKKLPADTSFADASVRAFDLYLANPSTSDEYADARFTYAELLFARGNFRAASAQYAMVPTAAKDIGARASYGAVVSLEKAAGDTWTAADEKTFGELGRAYVAGHPSGTYRLDVEYKMALIAYEKNRYDEAAPIFLRLGQEFAGTEKAAKAQDLYLDILNIKKDYRGIRDYVATLLKTEPAPSREQKIRRLAEQAYVLEIQALEEAGHLKEALAEYKNFARTNPKSTFLEAAVYNTFQLEYRLNQVLNAARTAEDFANQFPRATRAVDALKSAAQSFERMAQLKSAARVLEKLAVRQPSESAKWRELAADFYALDGDVNAARRIYGDLKLTAKLEALDAAAPNRVEHVEAELKNGREPDAFSDARRLLGAGLPPTDKARLRLVQAKVLESEFNRASVKARAERVGQVLAIKTEKLEKAQEAYQSAIKYGNPRVSQEAFERLHLCYESFVNALRGMPMPAGLAEADQKAFRDELDHLVIPLEEKSVDALDQAVRFARRQNALDDTLERLDRKLASVNKRSVIEFSLPLARPAAWVPVLKGGSR